MESARAEGQDGGVAALLDGTCNAFALRKASRNLTATYDRHLSAVGLRATQFTMLQKLGSRVDVSISELAEIMGMDRTTLATNLKPLSRDGLVSVKSSPADRRSKVVNITDAGRERFDLALPLWKSVQDAFEADFGIEKAAALRELAKAAALFSDGD